MLCTAQSLGSAALIANATVNAIVGAELSGNDALAGLPGSLLLLALLGWQRLGRTSPALSVAPRPAQSEL